MGEDGSGAAMHRAEKRRPSPGRGAPLPPPEEDTGPGSTPSGNNDENQIMANTQGPGRPRGLPPSKSTSDRGSAQDKQSPNRNVTKEIIAISNDNTQS